MLGKSFTTNSISSPQTDQQTTSILLSYTSVLNKGLTLKVAITTEQFIFSFLQLGHNVFKCYPIVDINYYDQWRQAKRKKKREQEIEKIKLKVYTHILYTLYI